MDISELYRRSVDGFDRRMQAVGGSQWSNSTPCTEWDVRRLVNHIVYEDRWAVPILEGKTIEEVGDSFDGDLLGDDPKQAWKEASQEALDAVERADLDRMVNVSWGQIPAREYLGQLFQDHLIHGWDLARGIDGDDRLDPELVEACWAGAKQQEEAIRASGVFGEQQDVPDDADTQTKLLALLGRKA
jgi:uncharacterized protein (TIGR03086 family)